MAIQLLGGAAAGNDESVSSAIGNVTAGWCLSYFVEVKTCLGWFDEKPWKNHS